MPGGDAGHSFQRHHLKRGPQSVCAHVHTHQPRGLPRAGALADPSPSGCLILALGGYVALSKCGFNSHFHDGHEVEYFMAYLLSICMCTSFIVIRWMYRSMLSSDVQCSYFITVYVTRCLHKCDVLIVLLKSLNGVFSIGFPTFSSLICSSFCFLDIIFLRYKY